MVVTLTTPPPALELISHDIRMLPAPYLDCTATLYDKKSPHNSPFRYETWDFSSKSGIPGGWPQFRENRHVIRDPGCWPQFRDDPGKSGILGRYALVPQRVFWDKVCTVVGRHWTTRVHALVSVGALVSLGKIARALCSKDCQLSP